MKVISVKRVLAYVLYTNLKRTAPKNFPDVEEMTITVEEILPALAKAVPQFIDFRKKADEVNNQLSTDALTEEAAKEKMETLQAEVRKYELAEGEEIIPVQFENSAYTKILEQFNRWGKDWFGNVEDFVAVKKALDSATTAQN